MADAARYATAAGCGVWVWPQPRPLPEPVLREAAESVRQPGLLHNLAGLQEEVDNLSFRILANRAVMGESVLRVPARDLDELDRPTEMVKIHLKRRGGWRKTLMVSRCEARVVFELIEAPPLVPLLREESAPPRRREARTIVFECLRERAPTAQHPTREFWYEET